MKRKPDSSVAQRSCSARRSGGRGYRHSYRKRGNGDLVVHAKFYKSCNTCWAPETHEVGHPSLPSPTSLLEAQWLGGLGVGVQGRVCGGCEAVTVKVSKTIVALPGIVMKAYTRIGEASMQKGRYREEEQVGKEHGHCPADMVI